MMKTLSLFVLAVAALQATPIDATPTVRYADGRLAVELRDAELADVVGEIARQARLEVHGAPAAERLTLQFDAVPLVAALARLLQGQSFALTYDGAGRLKGVRFLGASTAQGGGPLPGNAASTPEVEQSSPLAASQRQVQVTGLLATALGAEETNFWTVVGVALQSGDARLREEALREALGVLDEDSELRAELFGTLDQLSDVFLAGWLTEIARDHAEDVARQTARISHSRQLRRRAAAVARLVR